MGKGPAGRHDREPMATRQQRWMGQVVETDDGCHALASMRTEHSWRRAFAATVVRSARSVR